MNNYKINHNKFNNNNNNNNNNKMSQPNLIERRSKLCQNLIDSTNNNKIVIFDSAQELYFNHDCAYLYRQDTNLYYYCPINQPASTLVLVSFKDQVTSYLFIEKRDPVKETWIGKRLENEDAKRLFSVDHVYNNNELEEVMDKLFSELQSSTSIYYNCPDKNSKMSRYIYYKLGPSSDLLPVVELQRCIKDPYEIDIMRKSAKISANAYVSAMKGTRPDMMEYEIDAILMYEFIRKGVRRVAYNNIVASGENATILHYDCNNSTMMDGDLLLVDGGGEYEHYASDISRTWPINGKFSEAQREIYQIVLDAQKACIDMVKPGISLADLHKKSVEIVSEGLIKLGILSGTQEDVISNLSYKKYYMHGVGHWLGSDVHDCPAIGKIEFRPGMTFTVEPGLYLDKTCPVEKYRGIGVRIEDDILVTENGYEVLSRHVPKEISEIEAIMVKN